MKINLKGYSLTVEALEIDFPTEAVLATIEAISHGRIFREKTLAEACRGTFWRPVNRDGDDGDDGGSDGGGDDGGGDGGAGGDEGAGKVEGDDVAPELSEPPRAPSRPVAPGWEADETGDPAGFRSAWSAIPEPVKATTEPAPAPVSGVGKIPQEIRSGDPGRGVVALADLVRVWCVNLEVPRADLSGRVAPPRRQPRRVSLLLRVLRASGRDVFAAIYAAGSLEGALGRAIARLAPAAWPGHSDAHLGRMARKLAEHMAQIAGASGIPFLAETLTLSRARLSVEEEADVIRALSIPGEIPMGEAEGDPPMDDDGQSPRGPSNRTSTYSLT
jgi:hypothetical protein